MMNGPVGRTVNRAFLVIGAAFVFGGIFLGTINYLYYIPEALELQAQITGFVEDETAVSYSYNGRSLSGRIRLPAGNAGLSTGDTVSIYILTDAPEDPRYEYPREPAAELRDTLIIFFGPLIMGTLLLLVRYLDRRGDRRRHAEAAETMRTARRVFRRPVSGSPDVPVHTASFRGSWMIGAITVFIGSILAVAMLATILGSAEPTSPETLMLVFPLFLGCGIFAIGWPELYREQVAVFPDRIEIQRRSPLGRKTTEIPLRSVYGLIERITTITRRKDEYPRAIFREYAPLTDDPAHSGATLTSIPDDQEAWRRAREFSARIGVPLIFAEEEKLKVVDPEGEEYRLPEASFTESGSTEFSGRHIRLEADTEAELSVSRGSKGGLIWGVGFVAAGIAGAVASGSPIVLLPTLVMALFFTASAAKTDRILVRNGEVRLEDRFFGRDLGAITIPLEKIERIAVESDPRRHMTAALFIDGGGERIAWGHGTARGDLEWIESRIRKLAETL